MNTLKRLEKDLKQLTDKIERTISNSITVNIKPYKNVEKRDLSQLTTFLGAYFEDIIYYENLDTYEMILKDSSCSIQSALELALKVSVYNETLKESVKNLLVAFRESSDKSIIYNLGEM